jgi:hypothetical protein
MSSIGVVTDPRQPQMFQVWAEGCDSSTAAIAGTVQSSLWLTADEAAKLHAMLGDKLHPGGDTT